MPQRFLKPGIRDSGRYNSVSFAAQSYYTRLLTLVDDYGRYDGRHSVLRANCWAVWNEMNPGSEVTARYSATLVLELVKAKLWEVYEIADGKPVIQITQWEERARGKSKWPIPASAKPLAVDSKFLRNLADSCGILPPSPSPSPQSSPSPSPSTTAFEGAKVGGKAQEIAGNDVDAEKAVCVEPEFPTGFPLSVEKAVAMASTMAVPADFVTTTWHKAHARGGLDAKGQQIRRWASYVAAEWAYHRSREAERKAKGVKTEEKPDHSKGF